MSQSLSYKFFVPIIITILQWVPGWEDSNYNLRLFNLIPCNHCYLGNYDLEVEFIWFTLGFNFQVLSMSLLVSKL